MGWLRSVGRAFAKTFETTMSTVDKVDKKCIDPILGDEAEKKLFGDTLENHCDKAAKEFNKGREEIKDGRKEKACKRDSDEGCCGQDECDCGNRDLGWVEIR